MSGEWKLVNYECQDGDCLMIWHSGKDSKLGALSLDHRSIGEAIIKELNRLENKNADINSYVESVEESNISLKRIRDELQKENEELKTENGVLVNLASGLSTENQDLRNKIKRKNKYQQVLEAKIIRLKDRVKTFEHNYGFKDIERYRKMDNPNMITYERLWGRRGRR